MNHDVRPGSHWHGSYVLDDGTVLPSSRRGNEDRLAYRRAAFLRLAEVHGGLRGQSVLDIGCGDGYFALCAARAGAAVTAVDSNAEEIAKAVWLRERITDAAAIDYRVADVIGVDELEQTDVAIAFGLLYHLFDLPGFLRRVRRLSRRGLVLLDSDVLPLRGPFGRIEWQESKSWQSRGEPVLVPTLTSIALGAHAAGFAYWHVDQPTGRRVPVDYRHRRRAMLSLSTQPPGAPLADVVGAFRRPADDGVSAPFTWRYRWGTAAFSVANRLMPPFERLTSRW